MERCASFILFVGQRQRRRRRHKKAAVAGFCVRSFFICPFDFRQRKTTQVERLPCNRLTTDQNANVQSASVRTHMPKSGRFAVEVLRLGRTVSAGLCRSFTFAVWSAFAWWPLFLLLIGRVVFAVAKYACAALYLVPLICSARRVCVSARRYASE